MFARFIHRPALAIMLVGLLSKNAVLIVEFATQKHGEGISVAQAASKALGCASVRS